MRTVRARRQISAPRRSFKSEPDGYTLLVTPPGPLVVSQHVYPKLGFDPTAFVPVSTLIRFPFILVVNPKVPATNLSPS